MNSLVCVCYYKNYGRKVTLIHICSIYSNHAVDVNFAFGTYYVGEDAGILILSVERYTNTDTNTVVLVTTHSDEGTATGMFFSERNRMHIF